MPLVLSFDAFMCSLRFGMLRWWYQYQCSHIRGMLQAISYSILTVLQAQVSSLLAGGLVVYALCGILCCGIHYYSLLFLQ